MSIQVVQPEAAAKCSAVPDHLVVGVDGTEASLRALDMAALIARRNESSVTVVYVRQTAPMAGLAPVVWPDQFSQLEDIVEQEARSRLAGVRWNLVVTDGVAAAELERVAQESGAGLLVVGGSAGGALHRLIEGSVGAHAAAHARVPVLVVR